MLMTSIFILLIVGTFIQLAMYDDLSRFDDVTVLGFTVDQVIDTVDCTGDVTWTAHLYNLELS